MQQIIYRYALALFKLVTNESTLKKIDADIRIIDNLFNEQPFIYNFLISKATKIKDAQQALTIIVKQFDLHKLTEQFLSLLIVNRRFKLFAKITQQFRDLMDEQQGLIKTNIISAYPLNIQDKNQLVQLLANRFKQKLIYHYHLDAQLLGGFVINIGSQTLNSSLKSKLLHLQQYLLKS